MPVRGRILMLKILKLHCEMLEKGEDHLEQIITSKEVHILAVFEVQGQNTKHAVIPQQGVMQVQGIQIFILTDMIIGADMTGQDQVTEVRLLIGEIGVTGTTIVTMIMILETDTGVDVIGVEIEMHILKNTVMMIDIAIEVIGQKVTEQGQGQRVIGQGQAIQAEGEDNPIPCMNYSMYKFHIITLRYLLYV